MPASPADSRYDHERPRRRPAPDWGGDDLFDAVPRRRFAPSQGPAADLEAPPARRTVTITGHPDPAPRSMAVQRRRPRGQTVEQRIHARPDRLAAWAFALGLLLIAIAIATSA